MYLCGNFISVWRKVVFDNPKYTECPFRISFNSAIISSVFPGIFQNSASIYIDYG